MPGLLQRHFHRPVGARALGMRRGDVIGVARQAVADDLGVDFGAARLGMLIFLEHDHARALAHDEAVAVLVVGTARLFRLVVEAVLSARAWAKPAMPIGQIVASAPPASMMSASSSLIIRAASPIEWAPVEQAVTTAWFGPISPYLMLTCPEMRLIRRPWTKCGLTRPGPFSASTRLSLSIPGRPPMPEPIEQPARRRMASGMSDEAGVLDRLAGGVDAVDDERVDLPLDLVIDALVGVEAIFMVGGLDLAGDTALLVGRVEARDRPGAALGRQDVRPGGLDIAAKRRDESQSGDDYTAHRSLHSVQKQTASRRTGSRSCRLIFGEMHGGQSASISPCSGR